MTLPVLRKIRELVQNGATVLGPRPLQSPSLAGYPNADREVQALAAELWGDLDGVSRTDAFTARGQWFGGWRRRTYLRRCAFLKTLNTAARWTRKVSWLHRRTADAEIYFVANNTDRKQDINARFRVSGKEAELWHADTGEVEPAGFSIEDGRTTVPLHLAERESVFVVFRRAATSSARTVPRGTMTTIATVDGPWSVTFPANLGAPPTIALTKLESWTANADEGVKYFSGTATYARTVQVDRRLFRPGERVSAQSGAVNDLAEVSVNGQSFGILWKAPFEVDVSSALKPGANQLKIKVTNQWTNRLIGDRLAPAKRVLAESPPPFGPPPTLAQSGLLGPVTLVSMGSKAPQDK
jgi:hypothetical protein